MGTPATTVNGLQPYLAYKPSGVEWLGKVPAHWGLPRLGTLLRERKEMNDGGKVSEVLSLLRDRGVIPYDEKGNVGNKKSEDITRYKVVRPEDIVVNCMNVIIGSVGLSSYTGCLSPVYYVLTRRSADDYPRYLNAYFQTKPFQESLVRIGNGILAHRMRIPMELLKCEPFPHPPPEEQAAIARYLDHADRRIRRCIHAKEKLVKLLEEQRQALINEAVTGRVDVRTGQPYPAYKPSGMKWLGDVPSHWKVRRLRTTAKMRVSNVDKHVREGEPLVRLCNYVDVYNHDYISQQIDFMRATATCKEIEQFRLAKGDVLITKDSEAWDDIGVPAVVTEPAEDLISGYHLALLRPLSKELVGSFLLRALQSKGAAYQFHVEAKGVTRYGLSHSSIKSTCIAVPPLPEQAAIARYLDHAERRIQRSVESEQRQIHLLNEYRSRLIADVVTGKLDVLQAASGLPNDLEGPRAKT